MSGALRSSGVWRVLLTLLVLGVLAFTLQSLRMSGASYAAGSVNPANVFVAGDLAHDNDQNGRVMIVASGLEPGDSKVGTMTLTGTGTITGTFTLSASGLVDTSPPLSEALNLTIDDITGAETPVWEGDVADFDEADLGTIAPGASRQYRLTLAYPDGTNDSALQGATMTLVLLISGSS